MTKASASPWTPPGTPTSRGLPLPPTSPPPPELSRLPTPASTTSLSPRLASRSPSGATGSAADRRSHRIREHAVHCRAPFPLQLEPGRIRCKRSRPCDVFDARSREYSPVLARLQRQQLDLRKL